MTKQFIRKFDASTYKHARPRHLLDGDPDPRGLRRSSAARPASTSTGRFVGPERPRRAGRAGLQEHQAADGGGRRQHQGRLQADRLRDRRDLPPGGLRHDREVLRGRPPLQHRRRGAGPGAARSCSSRSTRSRSSSREPDARRRRRMASHGPALPTRSTMTRGGRQHGGRRIPAAPRDTPARRQFLELGEPPRQSRWSGSADPAGGRPDAQAGRDAQDGVGQLAPDARPGADDPG